MKQFFTFTFLLFCTFTLFGQDPCSDLFFSEYVEGSSNNKAIEIYNPTDATVDLSNYEMQRYNNGSTDIGGSYTWPAGLMLAAGDVWVSANPSADPALGMVADEDTSAITFFNGDDVLLLVNLSTSTVIDAIGELGDDPGTNWPVGSGATSENTLVRNAAIQVGTNDWSVGATQWDVFDQNDFTHTGSHFMIPCGQASPTITLNLETVSLTEETAGTFDVAISLVNNMASPIGVTLTHTGGTAASGTDFTFTSPSTVNFAGTMDETLTVPLTILDDMDPEGAETINLEVAIGSGDAQLGVSTLVITIEPSDLAIPTYPIGTINTVDAQGIADSTGITCKVVGTVYGINLNPAGVQFTLIDDTGGIGIFNDTGDLGYTVTEGDNVRVIGSISQFNGLTQINPDSIVLLSSGNPINTPTVITALSEDTESQFLRMNCVTIVNPGGWTGSGPGFNVNITNGTDTIQMRIDDAVDLYSQPAPTGEFSVIGIGGQFDSSVPHDEGYQLLPRSSADIFEDPECISSIITPDPRWIKAYPNPGNGFLYIESIYTIEKIYIYNAFGQMIMENKALSLQSTNLDMHTYTNGFYLIKVVTEQGTTAIPYILSK